MTTLSANIFFLLFTSIPMTLFLSVINFVTSELS